MKKFLISLLACLCVGTAAVAVSSCSLAVSLQPAQNKTSSTQVNSSSKENSFGEEVNSLDDDGEDNSTNEELDSYESEQSSANEELDSQESNESSSYEEVDSSNSEESSSNEDVDNSSNNESHIHSFGEWILYGNGNEYCENRLFFHICATCEDIEWKQGTYADHSWATIYSNDKIYHWYACAKCDAVKDRVAHTENEEGVCEICEAVIGSTAGIIYDVSSDGTYAEVIGYEGTAKRVRIADNYNGVPVTNLCDNAFKNTEIVSVIIPDSVTSIGAGVFYFCDSLTNVVIGDEVTSIGRYAFHSCDSLTSIEVSENNNAYKDIDGDLYSKDGTVLMKYAIGKTATEFIIPNGVTTIGSYTFFECRSLVNVVVPDSVTLIENYAFRSCWSLSSVEMGDGVTTIGDYAFSGCKNLISMIIPDSVTLIGDYVFKNCESLTSVVIGDSVTSIGDYAFDGCRSLTEVYYKGTVSDWENISIGYSNSDLTNATRYYYIENEEDVPTDGGKYWHYDQNGEIAVW